MAQEAPACGYGRVMNSWRVTFRAWLLMLVVAASAKLAQAESTTQWPGYVVRFCPSSITIQLDRDMNTSLRKGTIVTLAVTGQTQIEGNTQWPSATVEFVPSTKQATRIWFRPAAYGARQARDDAGCRGSTPGGPASPAPKADTQAVRQGPGRQVESGQRQQVGPAQDQVDQGTRVYQAGDQAGAARYFLSAAQAGHQGAQLQIGWHYEKGIGVPKSYAEAARWYRRSAEQGNSTAMKNLGTLYEAGRGVSEDWIEAAKWYQKSADLGNPDGESALARAYEFGIGVPQNRRTTIMWDERAAAQGNGQSAYYARKLRDPTNNIGFRNQEEYDLVMAGRLRFGGTLIGGDPAGILFRNSNERLAWLVTQRKSLDQEEAETWWEIRKSEYDRCRNDHRDYCHEPGPRP